MKDNETIFFEAVQEVIGKNFLKANSLGKKISSADVFLDKDYEQYDFKQDIRHLFELILKDLLSTSHPKSGPLSNHIDGLIYNHPKYGKRIVEFDEEQHFNTFRQATLNCIESKLKLRYSILYLQHCTDVDCFNRMLRKHRLRVTIDSIPNTVQDFVKLVQQNATSNNNYIKPKPAFNFVGGRIAQRAYYDSLRDVAHLAEVNSTLKEPLRFSLFEFEMKTGVKFERIERKQLCLLIKQRLGELA
jgi:hypothetical protein